MFKKGLIIILSISAVFMMLGGCSPSGASVSQPGGETDLFGQITAIDGSSITIVVGSQQGRPQMDGSQNGADAGLPATTGEPQNGPQGSAPPSGDTSQGGGNAPGGNPPPSDSSRGDGNAPDGTDRGPGGMTFTGEEQTITITDSTEITIQSGGASEAGTLADLQTGDIVTVSMANGQAASLTVMRMPAGDSIPGQSSGTSSNQSTDNAGSPA